MESAKDGLSMDPFLWLFIEFHYKIEATWAEETHLKNTIRNELTVDFGYLNSPKDSATGNPFQLVQSEMLIRWERLVLRRKPMQY